MALYHLHRRFFQHANTVLGLFLGVSVRPCRVLTFVTKCPVGEKIVQLSNPMISRITFLVCPWSSSSSPSLSSVVIRLHPEIKSSLSFPLLSLSHSLTGSFTLFLPSSRSFSLLFLPLVLLSVSFSFFFPLFLSLLFPLSLQLFPPSLSLFPLSLPFFPTLHMRRIRTVQTDRQTEKKGWFPSDGHTKGYY